MKLSQSPLPKSRRQLWLVVALAVVVIGCTLLSYFLVAKRSDQETVASEAIDISEVVAAPTSGNETNKEPVRRTPRRPPTLFLLDHPNLTLDREKSWTQDDYGVYCDTDFCPPVYRYTSNVPIPFTSWNISLPEISLSWYGRGSERGNFYPARVMLYEEGIPLLDRVYANLTGFTPSYQRQLTVVQPSQGISTILDVTIYQADHHATTLIFRDPTLPETAWQAICPGVLLEDCFGLLESSLQIAPDAAAFDAVVYPVDRPYQPGAWPIVRPPTRLAIDLPPAYFGKLHNEGEKMVEIQTGLWFCKYGSHPCLTGVMDLYSGRVPSTPPSNTTSGMEFYVYWYGAEIWPLVQEGKETDVDFYFWYTHGIRRPTDPNSTFTVQMDGEPLDAYYFEERATQTVLRFDDPNGFGGWAFHCAYWPSASEDWEHPEKLTQCRDIFKETSFRQLNEEDYKEWFEMNGWKYHHQNDED